MVNGKLTKLLLIVLAKIAAKYNYVGHGMFEMFPNFYSCIIIIYNINNNIILIFININIIYNNA